MPTKPTVAKTKKAQPPPFVGSHGGSLEVSLDLDALERENPAKPFTLLHGGHVLTFVDPEELDWQDLIRALQQPALFFEICLGAADRDVFQQTPLPGWKLKRLLDAYLQHHGIASSGEVLALPQR
jgi:hypothetical protein